MLGTQVGRNCALTKWYLGPLHVLDIGVKFVNVSKPNAHPQWIAKKRLKLVNTDHVPSMITVACHIEMTTCGAPEPGRARHLIDLSTGGMTQRHLVVDYENYMGSSDKIGIKNLAQTMGEAEWVIKTVSAQWRNQSQYLGQEEPVSESILDPQWNTEKTCRSVWSNNTNKPQIFIGGHSLNPTSQQPIYV